MNVMESLRREKVPSILALVLLALIIVLSQNGCGGGGAGGAIGAVPGPNPPVPPAAPSITNVTPNPAPIGSSVQIAGLNFGAAQGQGKAYIDGVEVVVTSWGNELIVATVTNTFVPGNVNVQVRNGAGNSNLFPITIQTPAGNPPVITNLNPNSGNVGTPFQIVGTDLSGATSVKLNNTNVVFTVASSTLINATVPNGATTGPVVVTTANGGSNGMTFTVTTPSIVYHKLVYNRALCDTGASAFGIAVANEGGVITYIAASEGRFKTYNINGVLMSQTAVYTDTFGVGYLNGNIYGTQKTAATIRKFGFNTATQSIVEPAEITKTWGSQLRHISTINSSIYIASPGTESIGIFDSNLNTPPPVLTFGTSVAGFIANGNESTGWASSGGFGGQLQEMNLADQQITWTKSAGTSPWQVTLYQNTLFVTNIDNLLWYKSSNGTQIGQTDNLGWQPTGICIYDNAGVPEAAVTGYDGRIVIYEVVAIQP